MPTYLTPGVHIEHVLTEPKRVLRTGVPVFLGLIRYQDLDAYNAQQTEPAEQFVTKPLTQCPDISIARKQGYLRLPNRPSPPAEEMGLGDPSSTNSLAYLRAVPGDRLGGHTSHQVLASGGTAGQTGGTRDLRLPVAISDKPQRFTVWPQFEATYGDLQPFGYLCYAVRGFFENNGGLCYVQLICFDGDSPVEAVKVGLKTLEAYDDFDLLCIPDIMWLLSSTDTLSKAAVREMQTAMISHCDRLGNRFALLDPLPQTEQTIDLETYLREIQIQRQDLVSENAALYCPWVRMLNGPAATAGFVPPCGHVASVFARTDLATGVHKAPANTSMEGVVDVAVNLTNEQQGPLNEAGINCLRAFPRRGIRVWGARTLSYDPNWTYVNVRRIFLTAVRWIDRNMIEVAFEPQTPQLWARIVRDLTAYFTDLLEHGAFAGRTASEAFYVKCDAETNPPEAQDVGRVVTEIGLAPAAPAEFIVVRIIHGPTGAQVIGPA